MTSPSEIIRSDQSRHNLPKIKNKQDIIISTDENEKTEFLENKTKILSRNKGHEGAQMIQKNSSGEFDVRM